MAPSELKCPSCRKAIPLDDVNVATDIALCRACGKTTAFSLIRGLSEISPAVLDSKPRHITVAKGDLAGGITITHRRVSPILFFLIPFTALWSGGSMWGIYGTQLVFGKWDLAKLLFGLPFLFGTVILLGVIAVVSFGKWVIRLNRGAGSVFIGLGCIGWTRRFNYNRGSVVSLRMTNVRVNEVPQQGIAVRTDDEDFVFGTTLKDDAKRYLAALIANQASMA